jgi:hypothetical protein
MIREQDSRNYKGGSWDLRKQDRRRYQEAIAFPDRRQNDRRATSQDEADTRTDSLTWVSKSALDE